MSKKIFFWLLPSFFLLISWSDTNIDFAADEIKTSNELTQLVNTHRQGLGMPLLIRNATANNLAQQHVKYMESKGTVTTDNFIDRLEVLEQKEQAEEMSENVGYGYSSAEKAMEACLKMSWQKVNVEGDFTHTGIAVKKDKKGNYYYTQIFYQ